MGTLFSYTLQSGIYLVFLYIVYKWMMAGEKQYTFNRTLLLLIYLVAIFMPFFGGFDFSLFQKEENVVSMQPGDIMIGPISAGIVPESTPFWLRSLLWVYFIGVIVSLSRLIISEFKVYGIIRRGKRTRRNGYVLVETSERNLPPFSWHNYVVVGSEEDDESLNAIMIHERKHVGARHCLDLLVARVYAAVTWYNPVSWLMIEEMKSVHEFQADEAVVESGKGIKEYQMLLIKKAVGSRLPSIANSLNHSKLKKRITMMYKTKSGKAGKIGSLILLPALAVGMAVVSIPGVASVLTDASEAELMEYGNKISEISANIHSDIAINVKDEAPSVTDPKMDASEPSFGESVMQRGEPSGTEISQPEQLELTEESPVKSKNDEVYFTAEKVAEFPGGQVALFKWLAGTIRYPEEAEKNNLEGYVVVRFVVGSDGKISDPTIVKGVAPSLDNEAIRAVSEMPDWIPGESDGKKVATFYNLPIRFKLPKEKAAKDSVK